MQLLKFPLPIYDPTTSIPLFNNVSNYWFKSMKITLPLMQTKAHRSLQSQIP